MTEWISVKDRLPEEDGKYLVSFRWVFPDIAQDIQGIVYYQTSYGFGGDNQNKITHWMPLPEPPEASDD